MYQEERIYGIAKLLEERKTLSNQDIMDTFNVSRDTARRDIIRLVEAGMALRTHGGITANEKKLTVMSYKERVTENHAAKERLVKYASSYLKEGRLCYFDVSTTLELLCQLVPKEMSIYTNSLRNLEVLQTGDCDIHMIGGRLHRQNQFFYGSGTLEQLGNIHFDMAFLGAASIGKDGIYVEDEEDAGIKRQVIRHCCSAIVIADSSKFTKTSKFLGAGWEQIDLLITDAVPPKDIADRLNKTNTQLEVIHE